MHRAALILGLALAVSASAESWSQKRSMKELTLLTRDDCVNTAKIRTNLDKALKELNWSADYQVIDLGTLAAADARTGYPTPTLLYKSRDIFGMPVPKPPYNSPT
ncbi:MAG TPA: hypothetical protein VES67_20545 [Vicinamibacterales bacterium]|nr:hypothetical protein [Vicinamibacterales bacterium]